MEWTAAGAAQLVGVLQATLEERGVTMSRDDLVKVIIENIDRLAEVWDDPRMIVNVLESLC